MSSKKTNLIYWISTGLFSLLMILSAFRGVVPGEDVIKFMHDALGYPVYFIPFISIAKLVGAIAILIPSLRRIKEWAYAGLFFDLAGAFYSNIAAQGKIDPILLTMFIWIVPGIISYIYW